MATKTLTNSQKIANAEVRFNTLYAKSKVDSTNRQLERQLKMANDRLHRLYKERDIEIKFERDAAEQARIEALDLAGKIDHFERLGLALSGQLNRARNRGEDQQVVDALDEQLDSVFDKIKEFYRQRGLEQAVERLLNTVSAINVQPTPGTHIAYLGPDKNQAPGKGSRRNPDRVEKSEADRALRAAMKGSSQGGSKKKQHAA